MVSAISSIGSAFDPLSYLNQVKGVSATSPVSSAPADNVDAQDTSGNSSQTATLPPPPSMASILGISSDLLSLLQNVSSSSSNGGLVSQLTGGIANSNPLAGVYDSLLTSESSVTPLQNAVIAAQQPQQSQSQTQSSPVQQVLSNYIAASNAYNQTLQQNAQAVLAANSFGADGTTPLVA